MTIRECLMIKMAKNGPPGILVSPQSQFDLDFDLGNIGKIKGNNVVIFICLSRIFVIEASDL